MQFPDVWWEDLSPVYSRAEIRYLHTRCALYKWTINNIKYALVQALRLCTGRTAHRGSRGIALPFHDHGTRRGEGSASRPGRFFAPGKDTVPIVLEAGWAPGPVWTGAENIAPTGIRSPDRPARSQSLYRLRYPAHLLIMYFNILTLKSSDFFFAQWIYSNYFLIQPLIYLYNGSTPSTLFSTKWKP